jgi:hypothetical protein
MGVPGRDCRRASAIGWLTVAAVKRGRPAPDGRLHVEEHMFDVSRRIRALGERFDLVF